MGRKNRRVETFTPLDLTPDDVPKPQRRRIAPDRWESPGAQRAREHREREERQRKARINRGIDWTICIVPGCGEELLPTFGRVAPSLDKTRRDATLELPICYPHAAVIWKMLVTSHMRDAEFIEAIADVNDALKARRKREHDEEREAFLAREDGEIYFVRVGGLVKVGWTRDLWARLKSYGASAELLVAYPATRADETNLHRQLTPARAKGREWYEDGAIIAKFIDEALAKYGVPPKFEGMWSEPKRIVAGKRAMRYR